MYPLEGHVLLGVEGGFIVGVVEHGLVRAGYDRNHQRIIVRMKDKRIFPTRLSSIEDHAIGHPPHFTIPAVIPAL